MNILEQISLEKNGAISLNDKIYRNISRDILIGTISHGTKLTEAYYSKKYQTSRTPIREVFRRLEQNGLIDYIPNKGAFVKGLSSQDINDMFHLRMGLEIMAVQLGITRITDDEEEELNDIFGHMIFYTKKNDIPKMIDINTGFHRIIYNSTHNPFLINTLIQYQTFTHYACPSNYFEKRYLETVLEEHRMIYNAYLDKNVEAGIKAMEIHMLNSIQRRL